MLGESVTDTSEQGANAAHILIVDDDEQVRRLLHRVLTEAGYRVSQADNGKAALELIAAEATDLVVTDLVMPGVEGIELISALRARSQTVPIIAISGGGRLQTTNYLRAARALGAHEVLAKPFELGALLDAVKRALAEG